MIERAFLAMIIPTAIVTLAYVLGTSVYVITLAYAIGLNVVREVIEKFVIVA